MRGRQGRAARKESEGESKPVPELLQCMDTLALDIETAFRQVAIAMEIFRGQLSQIRRSNQSGLYGGLQSGGRAYAKPRPSLSAKVGNGSRRKLKQEMNSALKANPVLGEEVQLQMDQTLEFSEQELACLQPTLLMQDMGQQQQVNEGVDWQEFCGSEKRRIARAHPMTDMDEIEKLVRDKWQRMSQMERREWFRVQKLRQEEEMLRKAKRSSRAVGKEERKPEEYQERFQNLLNKKNKREAMVERGEERDKEKGNVEFSSQGVQNESKEAVVEGVAQSAAIEEKLKRIFERYEV